MPTPTPPKPGEEPTSESELFRFHFRRLTGWYIEALDALPSDAYTWQPPVATSNTLAAMMSHVVSSAEWWVLSCVGPGPLERDRDAEFAAQVDWLAMRTRLQIWLEQAEALVGGMAPEQFAAISRHPAGDRMNRRCLMHTVEHMGLHLGHLEVTADWWRATHDVSGGL